MVDEKSKRPMIAKRCQRIKTVFYAIFSRALEASAKPNSCAESRVLSNLLFLFLRGFFLVNYVSMPFVHIYNAHEIPLTTLQSIVIRLHIEEMGD